MEIGSIAIASILGVLLFLIGCQLTRHVRDVGCHPLRLLRAFDEKMWMTFGLGVFFACLYLLINFIGSWVIEPKLFLEGWKAGLEHPSRWLYWGALVVVCNSLLIYTIRLVVMHVYNSGSR